ncbi:hypothetical protein [Telmatospirillum sp. J64-1]|uniref:hypothetical protein n=1 Tax=Telmatospirillum sp. J64-1 TaxID=2502183 RepID=UPI00115C751C|nr:hypothetical protein [Telmatospirillum sp. J64-1]
MTNWLKIVESLAPASLAAGEAGSLLEDGWQDPDGVALLRLMAGLEEPFTWHRSGSSLGLDAAPFGIRIFGLDPEHLAEGLDYLARRLDAELPAAQAEAERDRLDLEPVLMQRLHRLFVIPRPDQPPGVAFRIEAERPADRLQRPLATPDMPVVEDHRRF